MRWCGLKKQPAFGYHQAMHRAVLTLLVGLMLSLSEGASALTFGKDGKQINKTTPDHQTPQQLLGPVDSENKLLTLKPGSIAKNFDYNYKWNRCSLVSHNIYLILDKCPSQGDARKALVQARKNQVLKKFQCGFEGFERYFRNTFPENSYKQASPNCSDERTQFTLNEYARLEKIIEGSGSEIVDSELKPKPLKPKAELAAPKKQKKHEEKISTGQPSTVTYHHSVRCERPRRFCDWFCDRQRASG